MLRPLFRGRAVLAVVAMLAASCTDGGLPLGSEAQPDVSLQLTVRYAVEFAATQPVTHIRLRAVPVNASAVLDSLRIAAPATTDAHWSIPFPIRVPPGGVNLRVFVELLHVADGVETVEWSGVVGPFHVAPAAIIAPPEVELGVGPLENLEITGLSIEPVDPIDPGQAVQLIAVVTGGSSGVRVIWSSDDPAVATIDAQGLLVGQQPGTTTIRAVAGHHEASTPLVVRSTIETVVVTPNHAFLEDVGQTVQLQAAAFDADDQPAAGPDPVWSSSNVAVATVNATGLVTAVDTGTAIITADISGVTGTAEIRVGADTPPTAGRDLVVINDMNLFDAGAMIRAGNHQLVRNLVDYAADGPRANGTVVWFDYGRNSTCFENGECSTTANAAMISTIESLGMTVTAVATTTGTLIDIPPAVKVIVLWNPRVFYTTAEVNALKAFAAEGGRIVFLGEHLGFYGQIGIDVENDLLQKMGAVMTNVGSAIDCGYVDLTGVSLRPHQIMEGVDTLRIACASRIVPGPEDFPLFFDSSNTHVLGGVAKIDTTPITGGAPAGGTRAPARAADTPDESGTPAAAVTGSGRAPPPRTPDRQ